MRSQSASIALHLPLLFFILLSKICHVVKADFDPDTPPPTMTILPFDPVPTMDPKFDNDEGVIYARPEDNPFKHTGNLVRGPKYKAKFGHFDPDSIPLPANGSDACEPAADEEGQEQKWVNHFVEMLTEDGLVQPLGFRFDMFKSLEESEGTRGELTRGRSYTFDIKKRPGNVTEVPVVNKRLIIGKDDRVEITNTWVYPFSAVGEVGGHCTGTLIGPRHVLTAAHCVYSGPGGKWHSNLDFTIFRRPGNKQITWKRSEVFVPDGWTKYGLWDFDYALITLQTKDTKQPWVPFGYNSALSRGWNLNLNGFPSDKPPHTMWHSYGPVTRTTSMHFDHHIDLMPRQSGSGVYLYNRATNKRVIYGIHSRHWTRCVPNWPDFWNCHKVRANVAVRINKQRFKQICGWMNTNLC